jgi:tRNA(Ile)-lysidine synthase TilS/MesJ
MAMLHVFAAIRSRWVPQLAIEVIHFNHKVRQESEEEVKINAIAMKKREVFIHLYAHECY